MQTFSPTTVLFPNLFITPFAFITTTTSRAWVVFFNFHQPVKLDRYQDEDHNSDCPNNDILYHTIKELGW